MSPEFEPGDLVTIDIGLYQRDEPKNRKNKEIKKIAKRKEVVKITKIELLSNGHFIYDVLVAGKRYEHINEEALHAAC